MAFSREHKEVIVQQYRDWIDNSKAVYYLTYKNMTMPAINTARAKLRESESEMHVVKNRLFTRVLEEKGYKFDPQTWEGNNVVVFAFEDAPAAAKALTEITKGNETFVVAGGYLDSALLNAGQVKALADLPTLPVMRSMLLGTILAPASQLVRTLAEPARGLAAVIKANSEKQTSAA
ncbi:MAG: 50S ribosomal protein L10 [Chloroflexi bacterium]|mgnify:FL=1|nr:50S ribosomal protein L10 [Chloroflexota bacterium]